MQDRIWRGMIEGVVGRAIREIRKKSKRELRNLVELGTRYAHGRFQNDFFKMAQHMLENDNSPYYDMIFRLVNDVDVELLSNFCINIGYNSWCMGAKRIRAYERERGKSVPWMPMCDLDQGEGEPLSGEAYSRLIDEGKKLGIFSYSFFGSGIAQKAPWLVETFKKHRDCAFLLFTEAADITAKAAAAIRECCNVLPIVQIETGKEDAYFRAKSVLDEQGCLTAAAVHYDEQNADAVLAEYRRLHIKKEHGALTFLLRRPSCPEYIAQKVAAFANGCKAEPEQPMFMIDLYEDVSYVNRVISGQSCFLKVRRDGSLVTGAPYAKPEGNLREAPLNELLQRYMPAVDYSVSPATLGFSSLRTR